MTAYCAVNFHCEIRNSRAPLAYVGVRGVAQPSVEIGKICSSDPIVCTSPAWLHTSQLLHHGQHEMRWVILVVKDDVVCNHHFSLFLVHPAGVQVTAVHWKLTAGDRKPDAMPDFKQLSSRPHVDLEQVGFARLQKRFMVETLSITSA